MKKFWHAILTISIPLIVGGVVFLIISKSIDYSYLEKPPLAPPKIFFPIAWSLIYLLMGISYFIYKKKSQKDVGIYYLQLFVNAMWPIIFFAFKWRFIAIIWILLLDVLVIDMIRTFFAKAKISAYLNIPYLCWSIFATYLTIGIYILN